MTLVVLPKPEIPLEERLAREICIADGCEPDLPVVWMRESHKPTWDTVSMDFPPWNAPFPLWKKFVPHARRVMKLLEGRDEQASSKV